MSLPEIHPWSIKYLSPVTDYSESIFAVGNGYLGIRGFSLQTPKQMAHEHSLFRAGFYEPVKPGITDLVQLPDTLGLVIKDAEPKAVHQALDLRNGVMKQEWRSVGLTVSTERIVSMADRQLICIRMKIQSDTDCSLIIDASMNDNVANLPVHDDQMTEESDTIRLLQTISKSFDSLEMKAVHSGRIIRFLQSLFVDGQRCSAEQFKVTCLAKKRILLKSMFASCLMEKMQIKTVLIPGQKTRKSGAACGTIVIYRWIPRKKYKVRSVGTSFRCCAITLRILPRFLLEREA